MKVTLFLSLFFGIHDIAQTDSQPTGTINEIVPTIYQKYKRITYKRVFKDYYYLKIVCIM